jgi:hypothetical protein
MTLPTWNPLEDITATDLQAMVDAITELQPVFVRKTVDETVNNSITLQNDDVLALPMSANAVYRLHLRLVVNSGTTPDWRGQFSYPAGATATMHFQVLETSPAAGLQGPFAETMLFQIGTTGSDQIILIDGLWVVSTTAGTLQLRWAQNTANASDTKVKAGSFMHLQRMS